MRVKNLAAFLLCLTVTVSMLTGVIYTQAADTAAVLYVSDNGAETADGKTPETAVATMDRAFALLEAQQAETKTVKIIGSYTLSKHLPTHTESISIEGYDETAVLTPTRSIRINGPTVFDRVRFNAGGYMFCCDRNEFCKLHINAFFLPFIIT